MTNGPDDYLSVESLVRMLVDIVSKNGNLLLDVGPMADGTIPELQRDRLLGLGAWLDTNGEAIFGTRPWVIAEGQTDSGIGVRFTRNDESVYAVLLDTVHGGQITLNKIGAADAAMVNLLGHPGPLNWQQNGDHLTIMLPINVASAPAHTIKITPPPTYAG